MNQVHYLIGDATLPVKKPALICHVCNNINGWGRGFVLALRSRYPQAESEYHRLFEGSKKPNLGEVQFVEIAHDLFVANMIAQEGIRWVGKVPPIRYEALEKALETINIFAKENKLTIHAPRIGAKLSGGNWAKIEVIIRNTMLVDFFIYTLPNEKDRWETRVYEKV